MYGPEDRCNRKRLHLLEEDRDETVTGLQCRQMERNTLGIR
jgi:hypothetical protein